MCEAATGPSVAMIAAMTDLWRLRPPGPQNILKHPAFIQLSEICRDSYPNAGTKGPSFALSTALRALGLPCHVKEKTTQLVLPVEEAARSLDVALRATQTKRIHLAPLDLADDIPPLQFGSAKVLRPTACELRAMFDEPRLMRYYSRVDFDAERFSQFYWLVVEETVAFDREPDARAVPVLFMDLSQDLGRIEPHKGRFPRAFENALFFLLLAPWENWSAMGENDWRGFRVPWVYTMDSDLFVSPNSPPSPDTLSWEEWKYEDRYGEICQAERPLQSNLGDNAAIELSACNQEKWAVVEQAKQSVLFETPIAHFLVRAFLAEGVDEFLAHIITIEAALGLRADYQKSCRISPDRHMGMGASKKMQGRIAGLLGSRCYADQYEGLFNLRSSFLHGRAMTAISTGERIMARSLARQIVHALMLATQAGPILSREEFLDDLLDRGAPLL